MAKPTPDDLARAGTALRRALQDAHLGVNDLARRTGLATTTISWFCNGHRPLGMAQLVFVCDLLGVDDARRADIMAGANPISRLTKDVKLAMQAFYRQRAQGDAGTMLVAEHTAGGDTLALVPFPNVPGMPELIADLMDTAARMTRLAERQDVTWDTAYRFLVAEHDAGRMTADQRDALLCLALPNAARALAGKKDG